MRFFSRGLTALTAALAVASCTQVYTQSAPPSTPSGGGPAAARAGGGGANGSEKGPFKKWDEVLKDTRAVDGYFRTHVKRDNTLYLEVEPEDLGRDFGLLMHFSKGVGVFNVHDGLPLSQTQLMRFEREGDKIYLIHVNPRFTADEGSPMRRSLDDNVGHSVVEAFDIQSEHEESKALLIDLTSLAVSDYAGVSDRLKFFYGNKPVRLDGKRSWVDDVKGFDKNVEVDVLLTFQSSDFPVVGGAGVSDHRSVPVGVRYSFFALPEEPMQRRLADDRVGHFLTAVRDFSRDRADDPYVRFVNRWRLEKKDHDAEVSEPVEPIVYYIDRSVPEEYRRYVKEGIEAWNKAFEAAGYRNAVVARTAPTEEEDSTWSAEDVRYSTVRWSAAYQMGYAIGLSQVDPRTGEILNADILISSTFMNGYRRDWVELAGPDGMLARHERAEELRQTLPGELAAYMCTFAMGKSHQLGFQRVALAALGELDAGEEMPEEFWGDQLRDLIMHEVGHTLGLRHNMKGSSAIPFERLDDEEFTLKNGVTLSVMDYGEVNINPDRSAQGHYTNLEVGAYDVWAIRYGYQPVYRSASGTNGGGLSRSGTPAASPEAELEGLQLLADESAQNLHTYGTDGDVGFGGWGVDPQTNTWDLSADPLAWGRQRVELVEMVAPNMEERVVADGERYVDLRSAMNGLLFTRYRAVLPATKVVGGLYFHRDHKGQPGQRSAFEPVSADRQREAVAFIVESMLAEDALTFEAETLNRMAPNKFSDWAHNTFTDFPKDYAVHTQVAALQGSLLGNLLDNARLARMIDNEVRMPDGREPYTVTELFQSVTDAVWAELEMAPRTPRNADSFRRNLQRAYLDRFEYVLLDQAPRSSFVRSAPEDARSLARYHLKRLADRIDEALEAGDRLDTVNRAHLEESSARIRRALDASMTYQLR